MAILLGVVVAAVMCGQSESKGDISIPTIKECESASYDDLIELRGYEEFNSGYLQSDGTLRRAK